MMPTHVVLYAVVCFLVACGSTEPVLEVPEPEPEPAAEPAPDTPVSSGDVGAGGTVTDTGQPIGPCGNGGVPDDGDAEGCDFRVNACCYDSAELACAAAGCAMSSCAILESYPAQVQCE